MPRRFELPLAPLLARLGLTRPDENPLGFADDVRPVYVVGDSARSVPSPGGKMQLCRVEITVPPAAGLFGTLILGPPAGGAWLRKLIFHSPSGSYGVLSWENETTFAPGFVQTGTVTVVGRFDAREPSDAPKGQAGTSTALVTPSVWLAPDNTYELADWWYGENANSISPLTNSGRFTIQNQGAAETCALDVWYQTPLTGVRRAIG